MKAVFAKSLSHLLLGQESGLRLRTSNSLLALATLSVFAAIQQGEVVLGLLDQRASNMLTLAYLGGYVVFYLLIRLGVSQKLSSDPSMHVLQTGYGIGCFAWSYCVHGPTRGGVLMIMLFVLVWGMFSLTKRQAAMLDAFAFLSICIAVAYKRAFDPNHFELRVEIAHVTSLAVTLAASSAVSVRLGAMRSRLTSQKAALQDALAKITLLATHDELTGLLNRRALLQVLSVESSRCIRSRAPLSVAILDLDHFKRINDEHGHQSGDDVLQSCATVSRTSIRGCDVPGRWGGEEFLLVMPDTPVTEAVAVLDRVRQGLAEHRFAHSLTVTFSAGVSECASPADIENCIARADEALYVAKSAGRNRSQVATVGAKSRMDRACREHSAERLAVGDD